MSKRHGGLSPPARRANATGGFRPPLAEQTPRGVFAPRSPGLYVYLAFEGIVAQAHVCFQIGKAVHLHEFSFDSFVPGFIVALATDRQVRLLIEVDKTSIIVP